MGGLHNQTTRLASSEHERMLSVYPTSKGFGYLILENTENIIHWGVVNHKEDKILEKRYLSLLDKYSVDRVITEKFNSNTKRKFRAVNRAMAFRSYARQRKLKVSSYSTQKVDLAFGVFGAYTKDSRASAVASVLKPLARILPDKRKIYESENHNMAIFDCGVLALTHLYFNTLNIEE